MAARFVCVADEAFFLDPPRHFQEDWLPDRESTRLFRKFKGNAPPGLIPRGSTVQGVYCMTAEGDFLSGQFARASRDRAGRVLEEGWERWSRLARERGYQPRPVPETPLVSVPGRPLPPGGMKLEVAVRDLPRGEDRNPGREAWHRGAFNLNWIDFTAAEARSFVTTGRDKRTVPAAVFEKLALKTLKDSVRGQCYEWKEGALKEGQLETECIEKEQGRLTMRLTGFARLEQRGRDYQCRLHGKAVYDERQGRLLEFELVAAGQRSGSDEFNFREDDAGPAPMGVAYVLHDTSGGEGRSRE
jgi:hypothetical protein